MRREYFICDRCGKESSKDGELHYRQVTHILLWRKHEPRDLDLCADCLDSFEVWIVEAKP